MNTLTFLPETKTVQAGYMCAESENYKVAACFYHSSFRDINLLKQLYCRDPALFFSFFFWGRRSLQSNSSLYNVNTLRIRVRAVASRPPGKWCRDEYTTLSFFFSPFHWGGGREVEWPVGVATNQLEGWWSDLSSSLVLRNRLSNKLNPDFPCASVLSEYMNGK